MNSEPSKESLLVFSLIGFYFAIFSTLSVLKHLSLHSSYLDLGLESQTVWNTSQGRLLETSFGQAGEKISALSFHVSPISILIAPLYWLWSDPIVLLILQTAVLALGGLPIFWLSRLSTASFPLSISFLVTYLLYPPLQYSNLSDFHPQTLATPILIFAFWFLYNRRFWKFYLMVFLGLLVKENIALVFAVLGIYMIFRTREIRHGLIIFFVSVLWFLMSLYLVMPFFSGGQMGAFGRYTHLGETPIKAIWSVITHPQRLVGILLVEPKIKYVFHLLISVGFLSLLAPSYLLIASSEFLLNLFSAYNPQWQVKFHYAAAITPFVFISAIWGAQKLIRFLERRRVARPQLLVSFYLVALSLIWNIVHSPSPLSYKFDGSVFAVDRGALKILAQLKQIPTEASVSAMNNLGAHLSNRQRLYRFPIKYAEADYIVVDPKLPYENFDLSQVKSDEFEDYVRQLRSDTDLRLSVELERLYIFERIKR